MSEPDHNTVAHNGTAQDSGSLGPGTGSTGAQMPQEGESQDAGVSSGHAMNDADTNQHDASRQPASDPNDTVGTNVSQDKVDPTDDVEAASGDDQWSSIARSKRPPTPEGFPRGFIDQGPMHCGECFASDRRYQHTPLWCDYQHNLEAATGSPRSRSNIEISSGQRSKSRSRPQKKRRARSSSPLRRETLQASPSTASLSSPTFIGPTLPAPADTTNTNDTTDNTDTTYITNTNDATVSNSLSPWEQMLSQSQTQKPFRWADDGASSSSERDVPSEHGSVDQEGATTKSPATHGEDEAGSYVDDSVAAIVRRLHEQPSLPPRRTRSLSPTATTRAVAIDEAVKRAVQHAQQHCQEEKDSVWTRIQRLLEQLNQADKFRDSFVIHFNVEDPASARAWVEEQHQKYEAYQQQLASELQEMQTEKLGFLDFITGMAHKKVDNYLGAADLILDASTRVLNIRFKEALAKSEAMEQDLARTQQEKDDALDANDEQFDRITRLESEVEGRSNRIEELEGGVKVRSTRIRHLEKVVRQQYQALADAKNEHELKEESLVHARDRNDQLVADYERAQTTIQIANQRGDRFWHESEAAAERLCREQVKNEELTQRVKLLEAAQSHSEDKVNLIISQAKRVAEETANKPLARESEYQAQIKELEDQLNAAALALRGEFLTDDNSIFTDSKCDENATGHRATIGSLQKDLLDEQIAVTKYKDELDLMRAECNSLDEAWKSSRAAAAGLRDNRELSSVHDKLTKTLDDLRSAEGVTEAREAEIIELEEENQQLRDSAERSQAKVEGYKDDRDRLKQDVQNLNRLYGPSSTDVSGQVSQKLTKERKRFWENASSQERQLRAKEMISALRECARMADARHYEIVRVSRRKSDKIKSHFQRKKMQCQSAEMSTTIIAAVKSQPSDAALDKIIRDTDEWQDELEKMKQKWDVDGREYERPRWTRPWLPWAAVEYPEPDPAAVQGLFDEETAEDSDTEEDLQRVLAQSIVER